MDDVETAILELSDESGGVATRLHDLWKLYVTRVHPERVCPVCGYVAQADERFTPCQGTGK